MTDDEAATAALDRHFADFGGQSGDEQRAFDAGFAAGLAHARKWRALTEDPKTWPACGERVLFHWQNGATGIGQRSHATRDMILWDGYEYPIHRISEARAWLPLPAPPKGESK